MKNLLRPLLITTSLIGVGIILLAIFTIVSLTADDRQKDSKIDRVQLEKDLSHADKVLKEYKNDWKPLGSESGPNGPSDRFLCRAAIASIMGRDINIISGDGSNGGDIRVSYVRPDDGTSWLYKCRVDRNAKAISWGMSDGRWRTEITYQIIGDTLKIFDSQTSSEDSFLIQ